MNWPVSILQAGCVRQFLLFCRLFNQHATHELMFSMDSKDVFLKAKMCLL